MLKENFNYNEAEVRKKLNLLVKNKKVVNHAVNRAALMNLQSSTSIADGGDLSTMSI